MKKYLYALIALSLLFILSNAQAVVLTCDQHNLLTNFQTGLVDNFEANCKAHSLDLEGNIGINTEPGEYDLRVRGIGIGLYFSLLGIYTLTCPDMSIEDLLEFKMYGLHAHTTYVMGGAAVGAFMNKKGNTCFLAGINTVGLGVGLSGAKLTIKPSQN